MSATGVADEKSDSAILARYYYYHDNHNYPRHRHHHREPENTPTMSLADDHRVSGADDRGDVKRKCDEFPSLYSLDAGHATVPRVLPDTSGKWLSFHSNLFPRLPIAFIKRGKMQLK